MKRILLLLVLLSASSLFAQQKPAKLSNLSLNFPDYSVKFQVLNAKKEIKVKEERTYYWYAFNKIMDTKGGIEGKALNGYYTSFYLSEDLKEKGSFKDGLKIGKWITWLENGDIDSISIYKNGEMLTPKMKREKPPKVKKNKNATSTEEADKKTLKDKIKLVFKKKDKDATTKREKPKKRSTKTNKADDKKTLKEKVSSVFSKKDKASKDKTKKVKTEKIKPAKKADKPKAKK